MNRIRSAPPSLHRIVRSAVPAAAVLLAAASAHAQRGPLRGMDAYVEQAMRDWHVPGMAIAVVKDDSVVYMRGFGTRTLGRDEPVDEHTSFAIASTTKAFTATAIAMLVDEGKVRWDDPVSLHIPGFRIDADPGLAGELTVRDLLSHRTGIPGSDVLWYASGSGSEDILRRLRYVRPFASPRTRYQYNNNAYMLAGMVVEHASGMPWAEFVRTRILQPLGMDETLTGFAGLDARGNVATPHLEVRDTVRPIRYRDFDNIGPAGSINSSVYDMSRWIRAQLAGGARPDGERLVSEMQHREMLTPQFLIPQSQFYPAARLARPNFTAYGLGWFVQDYRGRKVAMHTGSIDGMSALLALVPEERLGMVVYLNLDHAELRHALMYRVLDAYLGGPPRDWSTEVRALYAPFAEQARAAEREAQSRRVAGTRPSLPVEAYAGTFADPDSLFPRLTVRADGGRLVAEMGAGSTGELEHWHYDVFRVRWADLPLGEDFLVYTIDAEGRAQWLRVGGTLLRRVPEPAAASQQD
jgi:CubicO group peptidase (beta-lactamase class C family)